MLPNKIFVLDVYSTLLESNHLTDQPKRMTTIKSVIKSLPEYHFCTLKFLINHLRVIADNSDKNKVSKNSKFVQIYFSCIFLKVTFCFNFAFWKSFN